MGTTLTNGREIVWVLFHDDGYECSDFLGVFDSQKDADEAREKIESLLQRYWDKHMADTFGPERPGGISVKCVTVGEYEMPSDAEHVSREVVEQ